MTPKYGIAAIAGYAVHHVRELHSTENTYAVQWLLDNEDDFKTKWRLDDCTDEDCAEYVWSECCGDAAALYAKQHPNEYKEWKAKNVGKKLGKNAYYLEVVRDAVQEYARHSYNIRQLLILLSELTDNFNTDGYLSKMTASEIIEELGEGFDGVYHLEDALKIERNERSQRAGVMLFAKAIASESNHWLDEDRDIDVFAIWGNGGDGVYAKLAAA